MTTHSVHRPEYDSRLDPTCERCRTMRVYDASDGFFQRSTNMDYDDFCSLLNEHPALRAIRDMPLIRLAAEAGRL